MVDQGHEEHCGASLVVRRVRNNLQHATPACRSSGTEHLGYFVDRVKLTLGHGHDQVVGGIVS